MHCAESRSFFDTSDGPLVENTLQSRFLCLKDFLKRCGLFPFVVLMKACKTVFRVFAVCFGAGLVLMTVGSSVCAREFFVARMATFAKDVADWLLLPFAFAACSLRLLLAFLIHPHFYFNALS